MIFQLNDLDIDPAHTPEILSLKLTMKQNDIGANMVIDDFYFLPAFNPSAMYGIPARRDEDVDTSLSMLLPPLPFSASILQFNY